MFILVSPLFYRLHGFTHIPWHFLPLLHASHSSKQVFLEQIHPHTVMQLLLCQGKKPLNWDLGEKGGTSSHGSSKGRGSSSVRLPLSMNYHSSPLWAWRKTWTIAFVLQKALGKKQMQTPLLQGSVQQCNHRMGIVGPLYDAAAEDFPTTILIGTGIVLFIKRQT